jgi:hypothetical protein
MSEFLLTGGCNCGAVRFEVTEPLLDGIYCHCRRCQRRTGAGFSANAYPAPGSIRIVEGEDHLRAWKPEQGAEKWFCGDCGSALFARARDAEHWAIVRLGAFDADPGVQPSARQFVAYAAPWEDIPDDGLPRHPEARPAQV